MPAETLFRFKQFEVSQQDCAMKINTDGVLLGAWVTIIGAKSILDIGTGSGVIAMMLAQRSPKSEIYGVEIDAASFYEAKANMAACPWSNNLHARLSSIQDYGLDGNQRFDLIVSNPPFFSGGTLSATQRKTDVRHAVKLSHSDLLRSAYRLMNKGASFAVVLPYIEGLRFIELAEQYRFYIANITEVSSFPNSKVERLLLCFTKEKQLHPIRDEISIRNSKGEFSRRYQEITKDFYLKF